MKFKITIVLATMIIFSSIPSASAHAQLTNSNPVKNQVIAVLPSWIWVEFDGDLMTFGGKNPNQITISDSKSQRVDIGGSVVGGARLSTKLKKGIKSGRYKISYRVVSEDGHPVQGSFYFTYRAA